MNEKHQYNEASFCGTLPIHYINSIQPQGILVIADVENLNVLQLSENASKLFGNTAAELVGISLSNIFNIASFDYLDDNRRNFKIALPVYLTSAEGRRLASIIHEKDGALYIELEHPDYFENSGSDINYFFQDVQHLMSVINNCNSVNEVAAVAAREIKALSGFDKVMIYSFDDEWVGTVIAEEMKEGMDSYMGLRFPSTDIPKIARDLYLKNPYRIIPDRNYQPVKLIPETNPITHKPADLSDCKFRGVMGVHLEYLKNMNVVASMSTRIIHKEKLWGLIACHHTTAKFLSFNQCAFFEFISNIVSAKIASLLYREAIRKEEMLLSHYQDIVSMLQSSSDINEAFDDIKDQLLLVLQADGVAIYRDEKLFINGITPNEEEVMQLIDWLAGKNLNSTTQYQALSYHYDEAKHFADTGSGLLVLPVQPYERNYVLAFRPEAVKKVSWGGDPANVLTFEPNSTKYHPRNSFDIWKEVVRYTAEPWGKEEMDIAEKLRIALIEFTLKKLTEELK